MTNIAKTEFNSDWIGTQLTVIDTDLDSGTTLAYRLESVADWQQFIWLVLAGDPDQQSVVEGYGSDLHAAWLATGSHTYPMRNEWDHVVCFIPE